MRLAFETFPITALFTGINWTCFCTSGKHRQIIYFVDLGFILFILFPLSCFMFFLCFCFYFCFRKITSKQNRREGSFLIIKKWRIISKYDIAPQKWISFPRTRQLCPNIPLESGHLLSFHWQLPALYVKSLPAACTVLHWLCSQMS